MAEELINVLKDFAAVTPFSFTESEQAAKRLLAYGIEYKNVMYVMQGIMSASAMQGNPAIIESVSRALGQIYTKGRLMNEEMRQLAEAGIPAYEILSEKLGMTQKELQNLGRQSVPAGEAINALIDGMNERFGTTLQASSRTLKGIISNIKDNATMLASGMMDPLITFMKSGYDALGKFLFRLREIYELKGIGGVFEELVPPEMQGTLRLFAANLLNAHKAAMVFVASLSGLLRPALDALARVYNAISPIITNFTYALAAVIDIITSNATAMKYLTAALAAATAMWVAFKVKAIAAAVATKAITAISAALRGLYAMLTFVVAHPFWALLIGLGGVLVGLSGGFGKLSESISGVFKKLTSIGGIDPDKMLLPSQKERANDLEKFNNKLGDTSNAMDDLAKSTGKAAKAAKSLLSFDEVFKLNEPDEKTGTGTPEINVPDIGDIGGFGGGDAYIPEVPDFSTFFDDYKTKFIGGFKKLWSEMGDNLMTAGIGALAGAAIGGILGGPLGAIVGAAIGALAGWFWSELADKLELSDTAKIGIPIATGLGGAIGAIIGGPPGAIIGAAIGALAGFLIEGLRKGLEDGDWTMFTASAGGLIGAAIGGVIGGPAGAVIGAAIGTVASFIANKLAEKLGANEVGQITIPFGMSLGAGLGLLVGGPAGAAIGAGIGILVGWILNNIQEGLETGDWSSLVLPISIGLGAGIGALIGGPAGAVIGAGIGALVSGLIDSVKIAIETGNWTVATTPIGTAIGAGIGMLVGGPAGAAIGAGIGTLVGWISGKLAEVDWAGLAEDVNEFGAQVCTDFENWISETSKT